MKKLASLSIVLPCHNEELVIQDSYNKLKELLERWQDSIISEYEIVMVNNGSTDDTLTKMLELYEKDKNIVILDLRSNYGYQGSITAGLFHAAKDMVVTIDTDLQDDPNKIKDMIEKYYEGYEMVLGVRGDRKKDSIFKRVTANIYYWMLSKLGVNSVHNHGDFRLLSKQLVEELKKFPERNRYLRGIILGLDAKYACVYYDRIARKAGRTKFTLKHLVNFALDGITSLSVIPIRMISLFGFILFVLSIIGTMFILYVRLVQKIDVPGWAFLSFIVMLFGGLQSLFIGMIGEYIAKTYIETKERPIFLVREKYSKENVLESTKCM
ncbi:glycosyltransferase family 2 protein [bacterium]